METLNQVTRALKLMLLVALIIIVSFLVASYFLAMYLGPTFFFFTSLSTQYSPDSLIMGLPIQLFFMVTFVVPTKLNVGTVFLFLWATFLLCFVAAWKLRESFHKVIKNSLSRPISYTFKNFLFAMPIITSMVLTAVVAIHTFQEAHGVPTGQLPLPEDRFVRFFGLTYASLVEEIGFRVTPMYAFLIPYLFWVGRGKVETKTWAQRFKIFFLALLYPEKAKKMVGLKTVSESGVMGGISLAEWIIVALTSAIFGLVHYLGGGWEAGKITSVFVQGFAMGLAYLLYGVQAPILIHWFFNYYGYLYYDITLNLYPETFLLVSLVDVATTVLGIIGWIAVAILGIRWAAGAITKRISPTLKVKESLERAKSNF